MSNDKLEQVSLKEQIDYWRSKQESPDKGQLELELLREQINYWKLMQEAACRETEYWEQMAMKEGAEYILSGGKLCKVLK